MSSSTLWTWLLLTPVPLAAVWGIAAPSARRKKTARVLVGILLAAGTAGIGWAFPAAQNIYLWIWAAVSAAYVFWLGRRLNRWLEEQQKKILQKQQEWSQLKEKLESCRMQVSQGKQQHKQSMTLYGIVRGLSEAMDWDSMRPKLEQAIEGFLGLKEFALYVADHRSPGNMHGLIKRHLWDSPASSWDRLEQFLKARQRPPWRMECFEEKQKCLGLPLYRSQNLVGYLFALLPQNRTFPEIKPYAEIFTSEFSFALERARLLKEVEELSLFDGLTGVYRRQQFDRRLQEETVRAKSFKTTYCLMILDLDHFKRLNDTYGHLFGDSVLKRLGAILKQCIYETDFVARYGGEEFVVILPRADAEGVLRKAERIRQTLEAETFSEGDGAVKVTVSAGIAHYPRDGENPEEVLRRADEALYAAKSGGRNRVVDVGQLHSKI